MEKTSWTKTADQGTCRLSSLKNNWGIIHIWTKPPFSLLDMHKWPICLRPAKCMKWKSQLCPCPGSEFTRSWAQARVSYLKGHTSRTAQMYYDHLLLPPLTGNITLSPFISLSCSFLVAFGTTRYGVPQLNTWGSPASVKLLVLWLQPKCPSKALIRQYRFSEGIWSYCKEFDTFTGPEAAQLCWGALCYMAGCQLMPATQI